MTAMNRGPRRLGAPLLVAVVVIVLLVAALAVGLHHRHPGATTHPASGTARTTTTVTATTRPRAGDKKKTTPSTTPTVPTRFNPVDPTANSATYHPPADTYTLTLATSSAECWVTVSGSSGSIFTETLASGQKKALSLTGIVKVIIGAPSALKITLDHEAVVLPAGFQTPFTVTLQPSA
jgi:hypothetical protein